MAGDPDPGTGSGNVPGTGYDSITLRGPRYVAPTDTDHRPAVPRQSRRNVGIGPDVEPTPLPPYEYQPATSTATLTDPVKL